MVQWEPMRPWASKEFKFQSNLEKYFSLIMTWVVPVAKSMEHCESSVGSCPGMNPFCRNQNKSPHWTGRSCETQTTRATVCTSLKQIKYDHRTEYNQKTVDLVEKLKQDDQVDDVSNRKFSLVTSGVRMANYYWRMMMLRKLDKQ